MIESKWLAKLLHKYIISFIIFVLELHEYIFILEKEAIKLS
jgi:hypothetical protein